MNIVDLDKLCEMFWDGNYMEIHKDDIPSIPSAFEGATNGEVVKALFPNVGTSFSNVFDLNLWWNAPYQKGE